VSLRRLAILLGLLALFGATQASASVRATATCTQAQKAARQRALAAYRKRMLGARRAYFKTHKSAKQRIAYVKAQQRKLRALERASACVVVNPDPPPPPLPPLPPAPPPPGCPERAVGTFVTNDAAVTQAQLDELSSIRHNVAEPYLSPLGILPARIDIRIYADENAGAQAYAAFYGMPLSRAQTFWPGQVATAGRESHCGALAIFVNASNSWWQSASTADHAKVLTHELYHVAQNELAGTAGVIGQAREDEIPRGGPRWLIEGAAEYAGYAAASKAGMFNWTTVRSEEQIETKTAPDPLQQFATQTGVTTAARPGAIYPIGFTAVDLLVKKDGLGSLAAFWRAIGAGAAWQDAFQSTFGETVDAFYAEFAAYRSTL
jgi:hypothetical protein